MITIKRKLPTKKLNFNKIREIKRKKSKKTLKLIC